MTIEIITKIEELIGELKAHFSPAVQSEIKAIQNEGHAIVNDAKSYVETNGLHDLEQLAITFVTAMVPGASWTAMLGALKAQAVTSGVKLLEGAEAVVAAKVQADLLAVGTIPAPTPAA